MNITELRYLVAIMKWGSVSAAAKQMYAAQPNVSKALKNLEEEYGIRIGPGRFVAQLLAALVAHIDAA